MTRKELTERGYIPVCKSSDLFKYGYSVNHWISTREHNEVLEYNPRFSNLPRRTASNYEEQVAIHREIGAPVVPPGCPLDEHLPLFDQ
jgi:hypothetical protein